MFPTALRSKLLLLSALFFMPCVAHANVGVTQTSGFAYGLDHPFGGLDHLCAMIAIGLWAAQMGGRALWAAPLTFISVMALGGIVGMTHLPLPYLETGILLSVVLLGVLLASAVRLPLAASIVIAALVAIFHGHSHGTEMPANSSGLAYAAGFLLSTALLHLCGIGLGITIQRLSQPHIIRFAGLAIFLFGAWMWVG